MERENNFAVNSVKKLYRLALAMVIVTGLVCLYGCTVNNSTEPPAKPSETADAPSREALPSKEATPSTTPTPTLKPKTLEEVKADIANLKICVDDLLNEDVVYPTVFGAPDESFTNEALKRISYFESFGIMDFKTAKTLIADLNYCYLNSDAVDKEKTDSYLSLIDTDNSVQLISILKTIIDHNVKNPDNQIVISWGIMDQNDKVGRAVINNRQQQMIKAILNKQSFNYIYISDKKYDVVLNHKDGSTTKLTGEYDDLNIAVKVMDSEIAYSSLEYIVDSGFYREYPSDKTIERFDKPASFIYRAFRDPEHANVRRHGFDANAYYEEDLAKDNP